MIRFIWFTKITCNASFIYPRVALESKTKMYPVNLPFHGQPDKRPPLWHNAFGDFLRSDHVSFWNNLPSMSAIFLSDTANLRSYMVSCYHEDCDNINRVTSEMLQFLQKTSDSILAVANDVTKVSCPALEQQKGTTNPQTAGRYIDDESKEKSPHVRESGLQKPGNFCLWIPESGKFLFVDCGIRENFTYNIRNPGFWNLEYSSRNPESH